MFTQGNRPSAENLAERVANTAVGNHISRKIQLGDPDTGWEGDPYLILTYDQDGYWRIWDTKLSPPYLVAQRRADGRELDTRSLCSYLRDASLRKQTVADIQKRIDVHNAKVEADAEKRREELVQEVAYEAKPLLDVILDQ